MRSIKQILTAAAVAGAIGAVSAREAIAQAAPSPTPVSSGKTPADFVLPPKESQERFRMPDLPMRDRFARSASSLSVSQTFDLDGVTLHISGGGNIVTKTCEMPRCHPVEARREVRKGFIGPQLTGRW